MTGSPILPYILIAVITWYLGDEAWHGIKWISHKVTSGIHHVFHPHKDQP